MKQNNTFKTLIFILLTSISNSIYAENIDLFIWAGQSNALGRQGDAAQYPADVNNLDNQIRFHWTVPNGGNSGGWTTMGAQDLGHYFPDGHFGPEVSFSRKLKQAGYNPAIFKFTQGATSIFQHWLSPGNAGLYDQMVTALNTAITDLENQGHVVTVRGFIWIQGESDSNSQAAASAYFNNLSTLLNDLRNNVVHNATLPIILGVDEQFFNLAGHEQPEILNAHQDIALNDVNIKFTSMYGYPKADVTHLTPAGLVSHGEDLFDAFQLLLSGGQALNNCSLTSLGNHNSFSRRSWGQSFTTDCSGYVSNITFEAISDHPTSATFTLYNGADCSGSVLATQVLSSISIGNNVVDLSSNHLYLDKEYTYFFDIVSDNGTTWQIDFSDTNDTNNVFGVLRCTSNDGTQDCGRTFLDYDMDFSVLLSDGSTQCANPANIYNFTYDGRTYEIVKENKTWVNAAACAVERGGKLVEINNQAEQDAIYTALQNAGINISSTVAPDGGNASYVWIGANDLATEGHWIWDGDNDSNGTQFWQGGRPSNGGVPVGGLYNNWGNEPDNWHTQNAAGIALTQWPVNSGSLGTASQWNDIDEANTLYYIIEYDHTVNLGEINSSEQKIYPNPVENTLHIENIAYSISDIQIINSLGQVIDKLKSNNQKVLEINFSSYKKGIYFVNIRYKNGKTIIKKLIK